MFVEAQQERGSGGLGQDRRELTALVAGCGVYRSSAALFAITGSDRVRWLNGMISNNVRDLAPGRGVYGFVLNPQGHILGDLYVFNEGESLVAQIERTQVDRLLELLRRYIIMDKVEIEDLGAKTAVLGLAGPESVKVLASAGLQAELGPLQFVASTWNGFPATLVCGDNSCVPNFELWVPNEKADAACQHLNRLGAEPVSDEGLETFRILCGIPKFGQDIGERTLPQETGQERALNFSKGCYIGQEIVERIRARGAVHRTFTGFEIKGNVPAPGTKVQSEGKDVGEITSILAVLLEGKWLALGYLRKEFVATDKVLLAGEATVTPVPLPLMRIFHEDNN
jgi:folate-binding protein YgfZ